MSAHEIVPASADILTCTSGILCPVGMDIHDVNRKKIVIRPRCKEYVQKQRSSIRTLACLSASASNTAAAAETTALPTVTNTTNTTNAIDAPVIPTEPKALRMKGASALKPIVKVASGRIEKRARRSPVRELPIDARSVVADIALNANPYHCGCSIDPTECRQCTLGRLADKFCAIVAAHKEKWIRSQVQSS